MAWNRLVVVVFGAQLLVVAGASFGAPPARGEANGEIYNRLRELQTEGKRKVANGLRGLRHQTRQQPSTWKPSASSDSLRGFTAQRVYPLAAPAVVVVKTETGHGTGFIFHKDGWILTNNHVIEDVGLDPELGAPVVGILTGSIKDRWMALSPGQQRAVVYRANPGKDLALLKLLRPEKGKLAKLPTITLAESKPGPGEDCAAIGHPAAGSLWSIRSGELTGFGLWPDERLEVLLELIDLDPDLREELKAALKSEPRRKVYYTDVGCNAGDSGGPLLSARGEVIGVTFAIPGGGEIGGGRQGTTTYHIHLDEVREFVEKLPERPEVQIDPWPASLFASVEDGNEDGVPDSIVFCSLLGLGEDLDFRLSGLAVDVDQDSPDGALEEGSAGPGGRERCDMEFFLKMDPHPIAYYDTDNKDGIDLFLEDPDGDGVADSVFRLRDGRWRADASKIGSELLDAEHFVPEKLQKRCRALLENL